MDFQITCPCCGDEVLVDVRNASLAAWQEVVANGQMVDCTCEGCGCAYNPADAGGSISQVDVSRPAIDSINVETGSVAGGTAVIITGHALDIGTLVVKFDGVQATNLRNNTGGSVTVDTPAHSAGVVDVSVENEHGQREEGGQLDDAFTYTT